MTTPFTRPKNDFQKTLAADYTPGSGLILLSNLVGLESDEPSTSKPIRLSVDRVRDGAKTILISTGRSGQRLSGVSVAEGKTDIPLYAGDVARIRLSSGYITELQDAHQALEVALGEVAAGADGAPGSVWREGSGAPSNGLGINGDFYLNGSTGDVYLKASGSYSIQCNIKGATGATGATGSTGAAGSAGSTGATGSSGSTGATGTAGSVWRDGTGAPSNGTGVNGDYYLNDANGDVYLRSSGTYSVVANIKGATGSTGSTGATGSAGATGSTGPSGVAVATAPITYNSGTQTVGITIPSSGILTGAGSNTFGTGVSGTDYLAPSLGDGTNLVLGTSTGTKIGTSTSQKIGFFGSTPIVKPSSGNLLSAAQSLGLVGTGVSLGGSLYEAPWTPPVLANFTWYNQGPATAAAATGSPGFQMGITSTGSGENTRVLAVACGATPWTATFKLLSFAQFNNISVGVCFFQSSSNALASFCQNSTTATYLNAYIWSNATTYSGTNALTLDISTGLDKITWYRLRDDGTNRYSDISMDGYTWINVLSVARTSNSVTPDRVGIFINAPVIGTTGSILLLSFALT